MSLSEHGNICRKRFESDDSALDRNAKLRYGVESASCAAAYLALTTWHFSDFDQARKLMQAAIARAADFGHFPTQAVSYYIEGLLEMLSGNPGYAVRAAQSLVEVCREHGISAYLMYGSLLLSCARLRADSTASSLTEMREALSALTESGARSALPMLLGFIADIEAEAENFEEASARVDEALSLAQQTGERWMDSFLHRIRGEILLRRDPDQSVAGRGGLSHRRCYRAAAEGKELRAASDTVPGEALSVDRPSRRCPGGPGASARGP